MTLHLPKGPVKAGSLMPQSGLWGKFGSGKLCRAIVR